MSLDSNAVHRIITGSNVGRSGQNPVDAYPTFSTLQFRFRPFMLADIGQLATLAGEHRIADTTIGIPYPYTAEFARTWIGTHPEAWVGRRALHWAVLKSGQDAIAGYGGLANIDMKRGQAELRFWVGSGVHRKGDAIEWVAAILEFAWTDLDLSRVYALQLERHPLAGRVLAIVGMQQEGLVRKRVYRGGLVEDLLCWSIVQSNEERTLEG